MVNEKPIDDKLGVQLPLPVLCVENGHAILRFSEIFCIHEPPKKAEKRSRRYPMPRGALLLLKDSIPLLVFSAFFLTLFFQIGINLLTLLET